MKINVNINDYLSNDEIKEVIKGELREIIRRRSSNDIERIITNSAYDVVWSAVDEAFDGESLSILKDKVIGVIGEMSSFTVFRKPDAWNRAENTPYSELMKVVKSNSHLLENAVVDQMKTLSKTQISKIVADVMKEKLSKTI